jgi:hypothetical protein
MCKNMMSKGHKCGGNVIKTMELKVNSTKKYIFLKNSNGQKT